MKLYLLSQNDNTWYDTYDSCIVAANSEEEARTISPGFDGKFDKTWAHSPETVEVKKIGITFDYKEPCVVLASFNAG
jgi:hypothetical protein